MHKKIFTNSFGILFSRILGFIRDLLTASILGANVYSDIFFVAFKFPNLFRRIFGEGAFIQSFMPSFIASKNKSIFQAAVFLRFLAIILFISILVTFFAPYATKLIAFGFSDELVVKAAPYVALNFYYLDLIFIATFLAALLQYKEHFATTAFSTALLNIALITALLVSRNKAEEEIVWALSIAVIVGGFLQVGVHLIALKKLNLCKMFIGGFFRLKSGYKKIEKDIAKFNKNFIPSIFGNSAAQISAFIDTWLASFLAAGSISYLYYSNRIFQLPLALFAIAAATAIFPSVSKKLKQKKENEALKFLTQGFWLLFFLLTLSTVGGIMLSHEIVWLLFERGAFTREDTLNTSLVLVMYMGGLLPYGLAKIFSLWLYSTDRHGKAAKIAGVSLGANIVLSVLLIFPLQAAGLALASTLSGFLLFAMTVKEFGTKRFLVIIADKKALYLIAAIIIEIIILYLAKGFIDGYL
ncbi:murein biosynthesis integral membrane protein MurJ [Nitrosophilus alvini]|uniref:murein biosynthesis integral membrane protein MurJ n=1 Tax=Nitrosophilus alvini TaxID=2714855 RepID=UPI00190CCC97|nr:murein biosynthesis integral membrane protein MurJ [Nitrosophilus alvini]